MVSNLTRNQARLPVEVRVPCPPLYFFVKSKLVKLLQRFVEGSFFSDAKRHNSTPTTESCKCENSTAIATLRLNRMSGKRLNGFVADNKSQTSALNRNTLSCNCR